MKSSQSSLAVGLMSFALLLAPAAAQSQPDEAGARGGKPIRTMEEIRSEGVVRQRWDISCGAAALSTLLTYDFKDNTPETAIVVWILHREDAARVRARGGFSLLDLKRFAQARGYDAEGFSDMSLEELASQKSSVIVPIRLKGFDHFVVVKGVSGDRVFLADPGFGNVTMKTSRFVQIWKNGVVFIVHPPDERMQVAKGVSASARIIPDETLIARSIGVTLPSNALY
jgi:predicted double-glycine peptidase